MAVWILHWERVVLVVLIFFSFPLDWDVDDADAGGMGDVNGAGGIGEACVADGPGTGLMIEMEGAETKLWFGVEVSGGNSSSLIVT